MFTINEDKSISVTRGDIVVFQVTAKKDGKEYTFLEGDILRMRVFGKKNCEKLMMVKDFPVNADTKTVEVFLGEEDTKFGPVISKPTAYWYEIELNPDTYPQTIIGYDEDGPREFLLYPEGKEVTEGAMDDRIKGDVQQIVENTVLANLPEIENETWWIGGEDTGKPTRGEQGNPGVYVGSGEMPEGYTVQFDPEGDYVMGPPKIVDGTWWTWDDETGDYVDTGVEATGGAVLTEEDKAEIVEDVLEALPNAEEVTTDAQEHAAYGEELASANGWTSTGWTGSFETGFTHTSGNTNPLIFTPDGGTGTKLYQISFNSSVAMTTTNLMVRVGGSALFNLYGQADPTSVGIRSAGNGVIEFVPESTFTGRLYDISIREVLAPYESTFKIVDSRGNEALEVRTTKSSDSDSLNGEHNAFIGLHSGEWNTSGYGNLGMGAYAMRHNTSGFWNLGFGYRTLEKNTAGSRNIGIGYAALLNNTVGQRNIAIGTHALRETTDSNWNISIGADNMMLVTRATRCIALGFAALNYGTDVADNIAIGAQALYGRAGGNPEHNVAIGTYSGNSCTGDGNTFVGHQSGYRVSAGTDNVCIGKNAYGAASGQQNVCIGREAMWVDGCNNSIAIGYQVTTTKSNQMKLGNANITEVILCGNKKLIFNSDGSVDWETVS